MTEIDRIRRALTAAVPTPAENPAWANCHRDCWILLEEIQRRNTLLERCLSPIEDEFPVTELELTTEIRELLGLKS